MDISLTNIGKRYRLQWIFRGFSYQFKTGEQYAILGPNGSGKSTLSKVISGHLSPSEGKVEFSLKDKKLDIDEVYRHISIAGPYIDVIEEFTLLEMLEFHLKFKPYINQLKPKNLVEILNFSSSRHKEIRFFSSGMKQRLKLVLAICSETPLILLDEPTTNLDAQGVEWYRELIETYTKDRTLIIASNVEHDYDFCQHQIRVTNFS